MSFEAAFENSDNQEQAIDNSLLLELNEGDRGGDSFIESVLDRNESTIMESAEKIADHFFAMMERLPEAAQKSVIDGFPAQLEKNDVVYLAMMKRFNAKTA